MRETCLPLLILTSLIESYEASTQVQRIGKRAVDKESVKLLLTGGQMSRTIPRCRFCLSFFQHYAGTRNSLKVCVSIIGGKKHLKQLLSLFNVAAGHTGIWLE